MEYNFTEIGERIRVERRKRKISQEKLIELLGDDYKVTIARNRMSLIENGDEKSFSLDFMLAVCKIFNWDMGYLLGEYQEKTKNVHEICEHIGLTENAIDILHTWKDGVLVKHGRLKSKLPPNPEHLKVITAINRLIENQTGNIILSNIYNYLYTNIDGYSVPDQDTHEHNYIGNMIGICESEKTVYDLPADQLSGIFLSGVQEGLVRLKDCSKEGAKNG